jgi:hypothetical protein
MNEWKGQMNEKLTTTDSKVSIAGKLREIVGSGKARPTEKGERERRN